MPVTAADIVFYGSANMQDTDAGSQGGAIDTAKRVVFNDISPNGNVQVVSSNAGDTTQTVTATGRDAGGALISEGKQLNGQTPVAMTVNTVWERLLKAIKAATCAGDVAVESVTAVRSGTAQAGAATAVTLDAGASAVDDFYKDMVLRTTGGTGPNQIRRIIAYNGTTKVATVERAWAVNPDATTTFRIGNGFYFEKAPVEVMQLRRPFYNAAADVGGGAQRKYYEKIFAKNIHGTLTLSSAQVLEQADPSGKHAFGLPNTLDDTGTSTDRRTAPGGITFDSAAKNVANAQNLTAGAAQGVWLELTLNAGDAAQKTSYTPRVAGSTT